MINCITISFYNTLDLLIYALYIVPHKYKKCMLYKDEHLSPYNGNHDFPASYNQQRRS